ncbi:Glycosyltransferase family 92 protein [Chlorella vulgaris]
MIHARQEGGMMELLFGGPSVSDRLRRAEAQQRQQQYAAELHAQMAAKEQQRHRERAHSLRQSATLLQLRQQAPSAVLPVFNQSVNQSHVAGLQEREAANAQLPSGPAHAQMMPARGWGAAPPPSLPHPPLLRYPLGGQPPSAQYALQHDEHHWAGNHEQPAVHAGVQPAGWQGGEEQPHWQHDAAAQAQWHRHDAQTHTAASGRRSWHESDAAAPPLGRQAPSAAAGMPALPLPLALDSGTSRRSTRPSLTAIGAGTGAATQREAEQRKRAAYQADLAAQMQLKQERQRQEKAAEQAADARRGREAQAMQLRAAAGSYSGGSGPLRGVDGRVITDLNKVRQFQAQSQATVQPEGPPQYREAAGAAGSIPAHWSTDAAASGGSSSWEAQAASPAHQQQQQQMHQLQQQLQQQHQQLQQMQQQEKLHQQQLQQPPPSFHEQPPGWHPEPGGQQPLGSRQQTHHALADPLNKPCSQLEPPQVQHAGSVPLAAHVAAGHAGAGRGVLPAAVVGGGGQQAALRMRSDRPYASPVEDEARAARQADFKAGLERQMQDKARQRAEELQRRKKEDAAEEARLGQEQDRLRQQGGQVFESGDVTIKFKPPPAARRQQQQQSTGSPAEEAASRRRSSADAARLPQDAVVSSSAVCAGQSAPTVATNAVVAAGAEPPQQPAPTAATSCRGTPGRSGNDIKSEGQLSLPISNPMTAPAPDQQPQHAPPVLPPLMPPWLAPQMAAGVMPAQQPWGLPPLQAAQGSAIPPWMQQAPYPFGQPAPFELQPWMDGQGLTQFPFTPQLGSYRQRSPWLQQHQQQQAPPWLQQQQQQQQVYEGGPHPMDLPSPWVTPPQQPYAPASLPLFQTSGVLSVRDSHADGLPVPPEARNQEHEKAAEEPMAGTSTLLYSPKPQPPLPAKKQQQSQPEVNVLGQPVQALRHRAPQLPALVQPSAPPQGVAVRRRFSWRRGASAAAEVAPAVATAPAPSAPAAGALTLWDDLLHDRPAAGPWERALGPESRQPRAGHREHQSTITMMLCVAVLLAVYGMLVSSQCSCPTCSRMQTSHRSQPQRLSKAGSGAGEMELAANAAPAAQQALIRRRQLEEQLAAQHVLATTTAQLSEETSLPAAAVEPGTAAAAASAASSSSNSSQPAGGLPVGWDDAYVAMCTTMRDEHCDVREWVLHHASLGVGKFYLFDTQSAEPMQPILEDLIASGLVHYAYVTNTSSDFRLKPPSAGRSYNWQVPIFRLCLERFGQRHRWMGFIDVDEFVVPTNPALRNPLGHGGGIGGSNGSSVGAASRGANGSSDSSHGISSSSDGSGNNSDDSDGNDDGGFRAALPALLRPFEDQGGVVLHWQLFGFNNLVERPRQGVLASYTSCWPIKHGIHRHVKSFVQPARVVKPETPHSFIYRLGYHAVDTQRRIVRGPLMKRGVISYKGATLHHYISKSLADFEVKAARRGGAGSVRTMAHFRKWARQSTDTCTRAVPLGQALALRYDLQRNVPQWCLRPVSRSDPDLSDERG